MANVDGVVEILGREPGQKGPTKRVIARNVITAGGLQSDTVAKLGGGAPDPAILTFRGTYYQMKPEFNDICATNIYPVPGGGGAHTPHALLLLLRRRRLARLCPVRQLDPRVAWPAL